MRLIDADKLRKDVLDLPNCYNGFSDTYDKAMIVDLVDEQPTVDAEPTEEDNTDAYVRGYNAGVQMSIKLFLSLGGEDDDSVQM